MTNARLDAARVLGRLMATREGRAVLADAGHVSGMPLVLIEQYETIGSLVARARKHDTESSVLIGIHYEREQSLVFITLAPSGAHARSHDQPQVDPSCHVGMLVDLLRTAEDKSLTMWLSKWDPRLDVHATVQEPVHMPA
jgi:hypothetical protein